MPTRVLIVDDDASTCDWLVAGLAKRGFEANSSRSAEDALQKLGVAKVDVVVTDIQMPGLKGTEFCDRCVQNHPDIPVIVMTAFGNMQLAIEAIRVGAYDFLNKPFELDALVISIERAARHRALRDEVKLLRRAVEAAEKFGDILGASPAMKKVFDLLERIADSDSTVLVTGETGTGKELVARALHSRSRRAKEPFVPINCAALPEALLESELFGHAKGAFTDAKSARAGLLVQATGGTLFLDEVGDMPMGMQVKLLRALQERRVRPVGGDSEVEFDVRIIGATNRDLETAVAEGRFREDLYYRLNVIQIRVPPLRARGNDVLLLGQHFLEANAARAGKHVVGFSSPAAEKLLSYSWPGNVRELQNCLERAVAMTRNEEITVDDLPEKIRSYHRSQLVLASDDPGALVPLEEVERRYILRVLEAVGGNKSLAAETLGLDRKTLYRRLERYEAEEQPKSGT